MFREQTIRTVRHYGIIVICALMLSGAINSPNAQTDRSFQFSLKNALLADGPNPLKLQHGERVTLIWTTDQPAEIHLHGYNKLLKIIPGEEARMTLHCTATGRFPVTLHKADGSHVHKPVLYIEVHPK